MDGIETGTAPACAQPGVSHWKVAFCPKAGEAPYIFWGLGVSATL